MPARVTQKRTAQQMHVPFLPISSSLLSPTSFYLLSCPSFLLSLYRALSPAFFLLFICPSLPPSLFSSSSPSHPFTLQTLTHFISCSLSSLRHTMTPMANFLPLRGGCWSSGLRTFRYSSEAFSRLVERDRWILKEKGSKGERIDDHYRKLWTFIY